MIYSAILVACLVAEPTDCKPVEFYLTEPLPFMQWREAETKAVEWLQKHPGYVKADLRVLPGRGA